MDLQKIIFRKYESFLKEKTSIHELESFCGFHLKPEYHKQYLVNRLGTDTHFSHENYGAELSTKQVGQFKGVLSKKQIEEIEKVFYFSISQMGYQIYENEVKKTHNQYDSADRYWGARKNRKESFL